MNQKLLVVSIFGWSKLLEGKNIYVLNFFGGIKFNAKFEEQDWSAVLAGTKGLCVVPKGPHRFSQRPKVSASYSNFKTHQIQNQFVYE